MLLELHVRNFALIEKADLNFEEGLSILTGETGAGKSILIDSINVVLGGKAGAESIRTGADSAYIELIFTVEDPDKAEKIREMDIPLEEDGTLIVSRRILPARSVMKINDMSITAARLRRLTGLLIDMHGQFEHQSLLSPASHLEYVDKLSPPGTKELKAQIAAACREYRAIGEELEQGSDEALRRREADILQYEIDEIESARLVPGEEEELLSRYRRMRDSARISENLSKAAAFLQTEEISRAVRELAEIAGYDERLAELREEAAGIDGALSGIREALMDYAAGMDYRMDEFEEVENRLDLIHRLQGKYGDDVGAVNALVPEKRRRLEELENYDANREKLAARRAQLEEELEGLCGRLSQARRETAARLQEQIRGHLEDLNFLGVRFEISLEQLDHYTESGRDSARFMISTNPGEPVKPLRSVASGGELSRIMLALKTVLADTDEIGTLIFDEIDAGISGITAQRVARKLKLIGRTRQVLCITHLPQIAAMADHHYRITKSTDGSSTRTEVVQIEGEEIISELARLMSGDSDAQAVRSAARELKRAASEESDE